MNILSYKVSTKRGHSHTTIILLIFDAAARIQEILDLTPADIDTTPGCGRVTLTGKGRKTRTIPIMDKTGRHLEQYLSEFHPGTPEPEASFFYTIHSCLLYTSDAADDLTRVDL